MCYFSEIRCKDIKIQLIMQEFMINYSINFNEPVKNGDKWKVEGGRV